MKNDEWQRYKYKLYRRFVIDNPELIWADYGIRLFPWYSIFPDGTTVFDCSKTDYYPPNPKPTLKIINKKI